MQQARVSGPISVLLRLPFAVMFGFVVTVLSLSAGRAAETSAMMYPQQITRRELTAIKRNIETFYSDKHFLPQALDQRNGMTDGVIYVDANSVVCDGWNKPFIYEAQGTHFRVTSYGADGRPGGTWLNADLTSDNIHPPESDLSVTEFLTGTETRGMVTTGYVSGLLAAALCLALIRPAAITREKLLGRFLELLALLIVAVFVGAIITALHVPPSGH